MRRTGLKRKTPLRAKTGIRQPRQRKCRICREPFRPRSSTQVVCFNISCSIEYARQVKAKEDRRERRQAKESMKTLGQLTREAQDAFNAYIRERDRDQPCISCARPPDHEKNSWDAGHFRTVGACPELRFCEDNCHRQCKTCNSGVRRAKKRVQAVRDPEREASIRASYRANLIVRVGLDRVEWIEGPHAPQRYRADDLRELKKFYLAKRRALEQARQ